MKISRKLGLCGAAWLFVALAGCSKTPVPTSQNVGPGPQLTDSRIESVQSNPNMSPEEKQKAIAILKSRETGAASTNAATP